MSQNTFNNAAAHLISRHQQKLEFLKSRNLDVRTHLLLSNRSAAFIPAEIESELKDFVHKEYIEIDEKLIERKATIYSASYYLTPQIIKNNPRYPWNKTLIAKNPAFTPAALLELYKSMPHLTAWEWVSENLNLSLDFVIMHTELPWNMYEISRNSSIPINEIAANIESARPLKWDYIAMSEHKQMNMAFFTKYSERFYSALKREAEDQDIEMDDAEIDLVTSESQLRIRDPDTISYNLAKNPGITMADVAHNRALLFNVALVHNPNLTIEVVIELLNAVNTIYNAVNTIYNAARGAGCVACHHSKIQTCVRSEVDRRGGVMKNDKPKKDSACYLTQIMANIMNNPNLTYAEISQLPNFSKYIIFFCSNPNITCSVIRQMKEVDWIAIKRNSFSYHNAIFDRLTR